MSIVNETLDLINHIHTFKKYPNTLSEKLPEVFRTWYFIGYKARPNGLSSVVERMFGFHTAESISQMMCKPQRTQTLLLL